jgi:cold shock CspA family protein
MFSPKHMFGFIRADGRLPDEFSGGQDVFFHFNVVVNPTQVSIN